MRIIPALGAFVAGVVAVTAKTTDSNQDFFPTSSTARTDRTTVPPIKLEEDQENSHIPWLTTGIALAVSSVFLCFNGTGKDKIAQKLGTLFAQNDEHDTPQPVGLILAEATTTDDADQSAGPNRLASSTAVMFSAVGAPLVEEDGLNADGYVDVAVPPRPATPVGGHHPSPAP